MFHFIRHREWLLDILERKAFQARFVYEELPELKQKLGIPMKCFCDIPLGVIKKHMSVYGSYGVGVKKEFAKRNKLSPVIYVHAGSDFLNYFLANIRSFKTLNTQNSPVPYFKMYDGYVVNKAGKRLKNRFYDEREWRYVPEDADPIDFDGMDEEEIRNGKLDFENDKLTSNRGKYTLPFEYRDITYLFVETEKDVAPLIKAIKSLHIKGTIADSLITKIITAKQIERDF